MKYILWKRLKTKTVKEFESANVNDVVKYAQTLGYKFTGFSYVGGFATFNDGKYTYSLQGQFNNIVCSYKPEIIKF